MALCFETEPSAVACTLMFVAVILFVKYIIGTLRDQRLPPGPWGLPFVGYLPWMERDLPDTVDKLSKKYGPIFSVGTGNHYTIFLANASVIKEAFWKEELTGRPDNAVLKIFEGFGITNTVGRLWKSERRFLHLQLQKLGMTLRPTGSDDMQRRIVEELEPFLHNLSSAKGQPMNIDGHVRHLTTNILSKILMSVRFEKEHPFYKKIEELHECGFQIYNEAQHYTKFPYMTRLPGFKKAVLRLKANRNQEMDLIKEFIGERRTQFDPCEKADSIIDVYLLQEYENKISGKPMRDQQSYDQQLCQVLIDLYSGGSETVTTSLIWGFLYLLLHPEVTKKVQEEIDSVVGRDRLPTLADRPFLTYTQATIYEILRLSNIVPMAAPHSAVQDTFVSGYFIPKGSTVISSLYNCHIDPVSWPEPKTFDPTRFINADGGVYKPDGFMPFGMGKRMCIADVLVRFELYLILATVLHKFDLQCADPETPPNMQAKLGTTAIPNNFQLRFIERDHMFDETIRESNRGV